MSEQYDVFNQVTPEEEKQKNEQLKESFNKKRNPFFKLGDGETKVVRFLDGNPLTFRQHSWIYDPTAYGGKGGHVNTTCLINDCPLCEAGHKARYVGAYRMIEYEAGENGEPMYKVFLKGTNTLVVLDKKHQRYDLTSRDFSVSRMGKGTNTMYSFDPEDCTDLPDEVLGEPDEDLRDVFAPSLEMCQKLAMCVSQESKGGNSSYERKPTATPPSSEKKTKMRDMSEEADPSGNVIDW